MKKDHYTIGAAGCFKKDPLDLVIKDFEKELIDLLALTGDLFYSSSRKFSIKNFSKKIEEIWGSGMPTVLKNLLVRLGSESKNPKNINVCSVPDDHDYGTNNCAGMIGKMRTYKYYVKSKTLSLMPWLLSSREHDTGLEYSKLISSHNILMICLDLRFYKSKKTILGERQKLWLKETIVKNKKRKIVLMSSSTLGGKDGWKSFKKERAWLIDLLADNQKIPFIISGDVHKNRMTYWPSSNGKIVNELTTSGVRDKKNNRAIIKIYKDKITYDLRSSRSYYREKGVLS